MFRQALPALQLLQTDSVYYDSIDMRKHKNVFDKTIAIKEKILNLYEMYQCNNDDSMRMGAADYPIKHIYIEQPFTFFNSGGSSGKTMAALQRFNGIVSWLLFEVFEIRPEYIDNCLNINRGQKKLAHSKQSRHLNRIYQAKKATRCMLLRPDKLIYMHIQGEQMAVTSLTIKPEKLSGS